MVYGHRIKHQLKSRLVLIDVHGFQMDAARRISPIRQLTNSTRGFSPEAININNNFRRVNLKNQISFSPGSIRANQSARMKHLFRVSGTGKFSSHRKVTFVRERGNRSAVKVDV